MKLHDIFHHGKRLAPHRKMQAALNPLRAGAFPATGLATWDQLDKRYDSPQDLKR